MANKDNDRHRSLVSALILFSRVGNTTYEARLSCDTDSRVDLTFYDLLAHTTYRDWKHGETVELTPRGAHRLALRLEGLA